MKTLADFRNIHAGLPIIVCGLGESVNELRDPFRWLTIGVNDIGRKFHPDYLVCINSPEQFGAERWPYVALTEASYVFTQLDFIWACAGRPEPYIVRFNLGERAGTDLASDDSLPYTTNSPYVGLCLAAFMGASRIGLIGVDFTDNHFWQKDGPHKLTKQLKTIDAEYARLGEALKGQGIEVVNLSAQSRLTAFPKMSVEEFAK